jgi:hypothetical protein
MDKIAVDATSVYWLDGMASGGGGSVMKVPVAGGTPTTLASGSTDAIERFVVDATNVYWATWSGTIMKVPLGGGTPTKLCSYPGNRSTSAIAVDAANVYWSVYTGDAFMKVPLSGGVATTVLARQPGMNEIDDMAVDATSIYWVVMGSSSPDGVVMKMSLTSGVLTTLASGQQYPSRIAVDSTSVYWITAAGLLMKVPLGGGTSTTLTTSGRGFALDTANAYWTTAQAVMKVSLQGGIPTTLVQGISCGYYIAVDATSVYFNGSGLMKIPLK